MPVIQLESEDKLTSDVLLGESGANNAFTRDQEFNKVSVCHWAEHKSVMFDESVFNKQSPGCKHANKIHNYIILGNKVWCLGQVY